MRRNTQVVIGSQLSMKARICPECETENKGYAWHCINCGATLPANVVVQKGERVTAVKSNPPNSPNPEDDIERNSLAFIAGALAGFSAPVVIFLFLALYSTIERMIRYSNWGGNYASPYFIHAIGKGITFGIIYGVGLALIGLILTDKKNIATPKDWAKAAGKTTFVILLVLTILASPWLLFGIAHMLVEGQEESVWGLFYLYIFLIGLSVVSGYVGGHIFKRLCQRRNL